jgi:hypothetical protein
MRRTKTRTKGNTKNNTIGEKLDSIHNKDRECKKKMPENFGRQVPAFQHQPLPVLPPSCTTPLDYFKLLFDDKFVEDIAEYSQLYATRKNRPELQKVLAPNTIRTSQAVMLLTGYMTQPQGNVWEKREDTGNSFVRKAISRDNFRWVISCTYFVDGDKDKNSQENRFWKGHSFRPAEQNS